MTRNEDCMQYSETDVQKSKVGDITNRQIVIQRQIETNQTNNNSNSLILSEGFGSADLQSGLLQDKTTFTRILPNEMTQYTRSHAESYSNLPSSAAALLSQNESVCYQ